MPLPPLLTGAALTALTAGLFRARRVRFAKSTEEAETITNNRAAKDALRARVRLSRLIRALGAQRLSAWRNELSLFVENTGSLTNLNAGEPRLRLTDNLPAPTPAEQETIRRNAARVDAQDARVQSLADAASAEDREAIAAVLSELGMTQGALREQLSGMESRRLQLDVLIPAVQERIKIVERKQNALADPIRKAREAIDQIRPGKSEDGEDAIRHHESVRDGLIAEVRRFRAESARLLEELPLLRAEQESLGERIDTRLERIGGRFELESSAGREVPRLVLPTDDDRLLRRQWQDEQHRHDLAEIALTAISPASDLADDAETDNLTIRWLMTEEVPESVESITVLGGLTLSADSHRATLTGAGGDPDVLRTLVRAMAALEQVLRAWLDALELLRLRSGIVQRRLQHAVRGNNNYRMMSETPLPGSLFGPRVFVFRSHQLSRALLVMVDGVILEGDGRLAADVSARMKLAERAIRLNGWQ
ncbi:MAG: hypothetical protein ACI8RZ_006324 [Myxococcota bacterium]|jgi:hypothetical protein